MGRIAKACSIALATIFGLGFPASASELNIPPVAQLTPEWCFAASAEMVFTYYGFPNLNPAGVWQCGIVGAKGGVCAYNCQACAGAGGTTGQIAALMNQYAQIAYTAKGYYNASFKIGLAAVLNPAQIMYSIDNGAPILAGISPNGMPYMPGSGVSEHAVVIEGYEGNAGNLTLIINDPFPPNVTLYANAGAPQVQPGQYKVPYNVFLWGFKYGNTITFGP